MPGKDLTLLDTIQELKHKTPFDAFRIVTSSGDKYLIEDPDGLAIGQSQLFYFIPKGSFVFIRNNQLVAVEHFEKRSVA